LTPALGSAGVPAGPSHPGAIPLAGVAFCERRERRRKATFPSFSLPVPAPIARRTRLRYSGFPSPPCYDRPVQEFRHALDLAGVFVFALSGATVAVQRRLDLFGVLVLAVVASLCGGIARDLLIGAVPPAAIADWRYVAAGCMGGLVTFYRYAEIERLQSPVQVFDAAGLGLFAVTGTEKALAVGLHPVSAVLLGMLTGIGGGVARDVLVAQVPVVLRSELYAIAAVAGGLVVVAGHTLALPEAPVMLVGAALCFALRFMAIRHGWGLPTSPYAPPQDEQA
jgi:uncharacterized membrane protein YeiH